MQLSTMRFAPRFRAARPWGLLTSSALALALVALVAACAPEADRSVELAWPELAECMRDRALPYEERPSGRVPLSVYYSALAQGCADRYRDTAPEVYPPTCYRDESYAAIHYFRGWSDTRLAGSYAATACVLLPFPAAEEAR